MDKEEPELTEVDEVDHLGGHLDGLPT